MDSLDIKEYNFDLKSIFKKKKTARTIKLFRSGNLNNLFLTNIDQKNNAKAFSLNKKSFTESSTFISSPVHKNNKYQIISNFKKKNLYKLHDIKVVDYKFNNTERVTTSKLAPIMNIKRINIKKNKHHQNGLPVSSLPSLFKKKSKISLRLNQYSQVLLDNNPIPKPIKDSSRNLNKTFRTNSITSISHAIKKLNNSVSHRKIINSNKIALKNLTNIYKDYSYTSTFELYKENQRRIKYFSSNHNDIVNEKSTDKNLHSKLKSNFSHNVLLTPVKGSNHQDNPTPLKHKQKFLFPTTNKNTNDTIINTLLNNNHNFLSKIINKNKGFNFEQITHTQTKKY